MLVEPCREAGGVESLSEVGLAFCSEFENSATRRRPGHQNLDLGGFGSSLSIRLH
jgi:hypothetical protein